MKFPKWIAAWLIVCMVAATAAGAGASAAPAAGSSQPAWPVLLQEDNDQGRILPSLRQHIKKELSITADEEEYLESDPFYELHVGGIPDGFTRQFLAVTYHADHFYVVLMASNADATRIQTLGQATEDEQGDLVINSAKLEVDVEGNVISLWSQAPFRAFQSEAELSWDGKKLSIVTHEYSDPTAEFFEQKAALLKKGDLAGLMKLEDWPEGSYVQYPAFYGDYFDLAPPALRLAYKKAMEAYRKGNAKTAVSYMHYGLLQYTEAFAMWDWEKGTLTAADIKGEPNGFHAEGRIPLSEFVQMLNDYGFFLSEVKRYKEAKPILLNVIKLAPSRAVAYLNAADTEWALGEKASAKTHYKQYVKLLGKNASKAPKRVTERIKAK